MAPNDRSPYCCCVKGSSNKQARWCSRSVKSASSFSTAAYQNWCWNKLSCLVSRSLIQQLKSFEHCLSQSLFLTDIWIPCIYESKNDYTRKRMIDIFIYQEPKVSVILRNVSEKPLKQLPCFCVYVLKFDKGIKYIPSTGCKHAFCWKVAGICSSPFVTPPKWWSIQDVMIDNHAFFVHPRDMYSISADLQK